MRDYFRIYWQELFMAFYKLGNDISISILFILFQMTYIHLQAESV